MGAQKSDFQYSGFFSWVLQAPRVTILSPGMGGCAWPWAAPPAFQG